MIEKLGGSQSMSSGSLNNSIPMHISSTRCWYFLVIFYGALLNTSFDALEGIRCFVQLNGHSNMADMKIWKPHLLLADAASLA
jgi:hypothetical protein